MSCFFSSSKESHVALASLVDMERKTKRSQGSMRAEYHLLTGCLRQLCWMEDRVIDPANRVNG